MNDLINMLNDVLKNWKDQYDLSYDIPLQFELDAEQRLRFAGKFFDLPESPELESANFDAKHITFHLSGGCRIYIDLSWPEDKVPYVNSVLVGYIF
ncbi:MAG: hypothetical protein IJZ42_13420 [Lachnospiraceae bacterium]|nr:hypothetical protein [Lachnospiraceae bacterium]